jgi:hypothetical protein
MSQTVATFWLARRGNTPAEYEDAFAADDAAGRYAVADGATESGFAALWARLLVDGFVERPGEDVQSFPAAIAPLQERWGSDVRSRKLPWHARPSARQGAFATFLGIMVLGDRWQAVAVGDTCLFHTRGHELLRAFPLDRSANFGNVPPLIGARTPVEVLRARQCLWTDARGQAGDRLWMTTDALAQWCLAECESGGNPWQMLESLLEGTGGGDFAAWIEGLRDAGRLRNDDVTLLAIRV